MEKKKSKFSMFGYSIGLAAFAMAAMASSSSQETLHNAGYVGAAIVDSITEETDAIKSDTISVQPAPEMPLVAITEVPQTED